MNLISFSLRRPVTISMIFLALSLFGVIALFRLPIEVMPDTDLNTITILINLRGNMPPLEIENKVTRLVEDAVGDVSHLEEMFSLSKEGEFMAILNFKPGNVMDQASLEVREKMAHIKNALPPEAERPIIGRFNYNDMPVFIIGVMGRDSLDKTRELVEQKIKSRFLSLDGVANVKLAGGENPRVLFELDQKKMASLGIDIQSVLTSLGNDNINLRAGDLRTMGQYSGIAELKKAALYYQGKERLIRLSEIGTFREGALEKNSFARLNGEDVVSLYIQKERLANTLAVTKTIKRELQEMEKEWQGHFKFIVVSDHGRFIKEAFREVRWALLAGIILAVMVLGIFLKDKRAIGAIVMVIPVCMLATFFMLFICKLSLNIFTMSAIALGVGMLVDNALVMGENISRSRRQQVSEDSAIKSGGGEVGLAMFSSTLTNVIVFLPLAFLKGETQDIFRSIGLTISFSLVFSLLCALTIVPIVIKRKKIDAGGKELEKKWKKIEKGCESVIIKILRRRKAIVPVVFIAAIVIFIPFARLGKDIMPPQDESRFVIHVELPSGARVEETDKVVRQVEETLKKIDEIETVSTEIEHWSGKVFVTLRQARERRKRVEEIITLLRRELKKIKSGFIYFEESQSMANQEVGIDIFGYDYGTLQELAICVAKGISDIDGLEDIKIKMREGRPEVRIELWPEHLASFGLTPKDVVESLHAQMRGLRATYLHHEGKEIETIVRLKKEDCDTLNEIKGLNFYGDGDARVSLKQVSNFSFGLSPSEIWHKDKKRMVSLSARRSSRTSLSGINREIDNRIKKVNFPQDYFYKHGRQFYDLKRMQREFCLLLILTGTLVYMVLASFFESYLKPVIIILMVPLSFSSVALFQVIRGSSINLGVLMGLVILGGMVVNSAILYMDRIRILSLRGHGNMRIVIRGICERLRPIVMTGMSSILGLMPLALASRSSVSLWSELAKTVMVGLSFSMLISLCVIPAILSFFEGRPILGKALQVRHCER